MDAQVRPQGRRQDVAGQPKQSNPYIVMDCRVGLRPPRKDIPLTVFASDKIAGSDFGRTKCARRAGDRTSPVNRSNPIHTSLWIASSGFALLAKTGPSDKKRPILKRSAFHVP